MNGITILIWITIAIIAIIAIILVKLHYRGEELEHDEGSILEDAGSINKVFSMGQSVLSRDNNKSKSKTPTKLNQSEPSNLKSNAPSFNEIYEEPVVYEVENNSYKNIEYESQNQVLVDYGNTVEKFQEPIKQSQMDIMSQNNDPKNEKHELKDLFTIDELIKESKRKDSEREKEAFKNDEEDKELTELKESIRQKQEEKNIEEIVDNIPEETIHDILNEAPEKEKEENIDNIINETTESDEKEVIDEKSIAEEKEETKIESPTVTSQDIEEAISTANTESKKEDTNISEGNGITDVLLKESENENTEEDIKEPILKTPTKVNKDYEFGADLKDEPVFGEYENDLDYRKDLAKITNTIKGSKIFQDVKEKLKPEPVEEEIIEEEFIRNVNEYEDDFEPIINETHADYEATYEEYHRADFEDSLRQQNTRKIFNTAKTTPESKPEPVTQSITPIKQKPSRDNIKIKLNNNEIVLKKGDEIIFNHQGETYSSQVYAINGDDISVKYRRKNIVIKASDVKKVY
ncbi:MAG: ATPase [Methanobrevibacter sp.]|nr:ATPase [Methanobrevibacter sp.]